MNSNEMNIETALKYVLENHTDGRRTAAAEFLADKIVALSTTEASKGAVELLGRAGKNSGSNINAVTDKITTLEEAAHFARQVTIAPTWQEIQEIHKLGSRRKWIVKQLDPQFKEYPNWQDDGNGVMQRQPGIFGYAAMYYGPPRTNNGTTNKKPNYAFAGMKYTSRMLLNALLSHDTHGHIPTLHHSLELKATWILSKFIVCSIPGGAWDASDKSFQIASWYSALNAHALGNYHDLLEEVTYNPNMGVMLTHLANQKQTGEAHPDENYAREIMQLMTIGLWELNRDGTYKLDGNGKRIPTYTNEDVSQLARAMTGLCRWDRPEAEYTNPSDSVKAIMSSTGISSMIAASYTLNFISPRMKHYIPFYETGEKVALKGHLNIPEGTDPVTNIKMAIEALVSHPSCAPFVCKNLIRHAVTSNPSPAYVERVVTVFEDNGEGVRGDMAAVWEAIFCDPEATHTIHTSPTHGRIRDGFELYSNYTRTFKCESNMPVVSADSNDANFLNGTLITTAQNGYICDNFLSARYGTWPAMAPSIFGYYAQDYQPDALEYRKMVAPELDVLSPALMNDMIRHIIAIAGQREPRDAASDLNPTCRSYAPIVPDSGTATELVNRLNLLLCGGTLTEAKKAALIAWLESRPISTDAERQNRVMHALQYIFSSTEFMVM